MPLVAARWQGAHQHLMTENSQVGGGPFWRTVREGRRRRRTDGSGARPVSGRNERMTTANVMATATNMARQSINMPAGP